ncbi:PX domain-containing protein EREX [Selaginella moellendorffii]|uniref:PX domain-containing protein EREX n=1 Tax=Selaginella moellendorffii TaxID=88036 RepID=UPI000D1D0D38|nr:PX domain-containing protein EREX [Selaginella moellendorffii]XP_024538095.1 PX domain-containing protein EREX [Selaginella moellendorffii]|eukprot:XP_024538094.1 PX domain-containing protein EREX [Selaginella moellendorffii]
MSSLLSDIEISRSAPVAAFLELEAAARSAASAASAQEDSASVIAGLALEDSGLIAPSSLYNGSSSVASLPDYASDAACSTSGVRTPTSLSELGVEVETADDIATAQRKKKGKDVEQGLEDGKQDSETSKIFRSVSEATLDNFHRRKDSDSDIASEQSIPMSVEGPSDTSLVLAAGIERRMEGVSSFESDILKGASVFLPADQRANVKRVMAALQRRFEIVKADMEDLITRLNQEVAVKGFLTIKVRDLEAELDNTRRKSQDVLQQAVSVERERVTELQWELEDCRTALMNVEESLQTERNDRGMESESLQSIRVELDNSKQQVVQLQEKLESLAKERDAIEAQARAEKRILAKEIKTLRKNQPELKEELDTALRIKAELEGVLRKEREKEELARNSRASFMHEVSALRQRLQECSVDFLAKEDGAKNSISSDAMELLTTSDNRINLLLAEARLMAEERDEDEDEHYPTANGATANSNPPDGSGSEDAVNKFLVDILIDNAQLRKSMNSLTRSALLAVQKRDNIEGAMEEAAPKRSSVLNRFL